jgi:hypothetical protein
MTLFFWRALVTEKDDEDMQPVGDMVDVRFVKTSVAARNKQKAICSP